jgi:hypothetical protein
MYLILFDRVDRLGSQIINYLFQILFAHKNKIIIKFKDNSKENYKYYNSSIFIQILFNYIDELNKKLLSEQINDDILFEFDNPGEYISNISFTLQDIKLDYLSYFKKFIYNTIKIDILNIKDLYNNIPFDINKTILIHLRLDDTSNLSDYDGSICSNYYKAKIIKNEKCYYINNNNNIQAPLSKQKILNIIDKAKTIFNDREVILLTSPNSDTSNFDYRVIKNNDENYDFYLLSLCKVVILSRSNFAITSLFFTDNKDKVYLPLWGHTACIGFDTIYDNNNNSIYEYFY